MKVEDSKQESKEEPQKQESKEEEEEDKHAMKQTNDVATFQVVSEATDHMFSSVSRL